MNRRIALFVWPLGLLLMGSIREPARVSIEGLQYVPAEVTIRRGQTVTWTNNDDREHVVRAGDGSFQSPPLLPGETFTRTFANPGTFRIGCPLHPRERGTVIVD